MKRYEFMVSALALIWLAVVGGGLFVVWHFVAKFW